jgi:hypothetical protein
VPRILQPTKIKASKTLSSSTRPKLTNCNDPDAVTAAIQHDIALKQNDRTNMTEMPEETLDVRAVNTKLKHGQHLGLVSRPTVALLE